jgi:hypothetical protein
MVKKSNWAVSLLSSKQKFVTSIIKLLRLPKLQFKTLVALSPFIFKEKCWNENVSCTEGMSVQADETLKRIKSNKKCSRDDGRTSEYFVVQLK